MTKILKLFLIVTILFSFNIPSASADVVYLEDRGDRFSVSFPDRWKRQHNQAVDDRLVISAPGAASDAASCRVRVRDDARFSIYPHKYDASIQKIAYGREFWSDYIAQNYVDAALVSVTDGAQLGRGFASYANVKFTSDLDASVQKRGVMFVSLYGNKAYIIDCSAEVSAYARWYASFMGVIKSVDFEQAIYIPADSGYRPFLRDPVLVVNNGSSYTTRYY